MTRILLACLLCLAAVSAFAAEATLRIMNRDVAVLRADLAGATPAQRVERARARLAAIGDHDLGQPVHHEPFTLGEARGEMFLIGHHPLFTLLESDADTTTGESFPTLVKQTQEKLEEIRQARLEQGRLAFMLKESGLSLVATTLLALLVWAILRGARAIEHRLTHVHDKFAHVARIAWQEYAAHFAMRVMRLAQWLLIAGLIYAWTVFVLERFPLTRPLGERTGAFIIQLADWVGAGLVSALPGLFTIAVIFVLTRALVDVLSTFVQQVQSGRVQVPFIHAETASATRRILALLIWSIGIAIAYPFIPGSNSDVFKGLSIMFGLMLSLGSSGLVTQMMSGLVVVYSRSLRKGDLISVNGIDGVVTHVGPLATKLVNLRNEEITIPNAVLTGHAIRNYSRLSEGQGPMIQTSVTIGYDTPWRQVHAMLLMAAQRTAGIKTTPPAFVLQRALGDFYVEYELIANIDDPLKRYRTLSELHANIQDAFNEHGVQIMSPHFMDQPAQPVVTPRENWYAAPARPEGANAAHLDK